MLAAVEQKAWVKAEQAKLDAIVAERQSRQQERLAACTMREDALGSDSYGRRYWYLLCEPSRLWVEESTADAPAAGGRRWSYYDRVGDVEDLVASLDGTGARP